MIELSQPRRHNLARAASTPPDWVDQDSSEWTRSFAVLVRTLELTIVETSSSGNTEGGNSEL